MALVFFCQAYLVGGDEKGMGDAVFEGIVFFLVTDGEVEADGVGIGFDPFGDDVIDGAAELFAGVIGLYFETADHQAGQTVQLAGTLQVPEHTVNAIKIFPGVFHEQDLSGGIDIRDGTGNAFDGLEVAADKLAFCGPGPVLSLCRRGVLHFSPLNAWRIERIEADLYRLGFCPVIGKAVAHFGVDRGDVQITVDVAEQDGDIAKADDPFWSLQQGRKIQLIDNVNGAIAAPGAEHGFDFRDRRVICWKSASLSASVPTAINEILFPNGIAGFCLKTPAFYLLNGGLDFLQGDIAGGTGDADGIAGFQIRRDQQGLRNGCEIIPVAAGSYGGMADRVVDAADRFAADGRQVNPSTDAKKVFSIHLYNIINIATKLKITTFNTCVLYWQW